MFDEARLYDCVLAVDKSTRCIKIQFNVVPNSSVIEYLTLVVNQPGLISSSMVLLETGKSSTVDIYTNRGWDLDKLSLLISEELCTTHQLRTSITGI